MNKTDRRRPDADTVQALTIEELDMLLSFISKRDMEEKTKQALRDRLNYGMSLKEASDKNVVNYRNVSRAELKITSMHQRIKEMYC